MRDERAFDVITQGFWKQKTWLSQTTKFGSYQGTGSFDRAFCCRHDNTNGSASMWSEPQGRRLSISTGFARSSPLSWSFLPCMSSGRVGLPFGRFRLHGRFHSKLLPTSRDRRVASSFSMRMRWQICCSRSRRQTAARQDIKDGPARSQVPHDHGRHGCRQLGRPARRDDGPLAGQGGPWLRDPEIMDKATHPPPRCKEGALVEAMQHRWCSPIPDGILAR